MALTIQQVPIRAPNQIGAQNQLLQMGLSGLQNLPAAQSFDPIAQRARSQFKSDVVPGLAERFTSLGGGQRSSAFEGALGNAGAGLEEALAALGSQFGLQQRGQEISLLQSLLGMGLTPQFENISQPKGPGFGATIGSGLGALLPLLIGGAIGGPAGAAAGSGVGSLLSGLFNRNAPQQQFSPQSFNQQEQPLDLLRQILGQLSPLYAATNPVL